MYDPKAKRGFAKSPLALFLARCSLVATLRDIPQLWSGMPVFIGLIVPNPNQVETYIEATPGFVEKHLSGSTMTDIYRGTELVILETEKSVSKCSGSAFSTVLKLYDRVAMVVSEEAEFPDQFRLASDVIRTVTPITAEYIRAGVRVCFGAEMTLEQATAFLEVPLETIDLVLKQGRSIQDSMERIGRAMKASEPQPAPSSDNPLLDLSSLRGLGEATVWGHELAQDIADWKNRHISWKDVDRGVLISGPPGTGKTTFAAALARTCGVPLIAASLAIWQSKGHLGDTLAAMRKSFTEASMKKPSILFIDEIDAVGDRNSFSGHNAHYCREVVAALLECMDGTGKRDGVVIVGATNTPELIDPALTRSGRLDRHIAIPLPDQDARVGILRWHLQGSLAGEDLQPVVMRTEGGSGADLEQIVRHARRLARRSRREITVEDLTAMLPERVPLSPEARWRYAVHESGHVMVALAIGFVGIESVSITDSADASAVSTSAGETHYTSTLEWAFTRDHYLAQICTCFGGMAAEEVILGIRSTSAGGVPQSDLYQATITAVQIEASYGLGGSLGYLASHKADEALTAYRSDFSIRKRTDELLTQQYAITKGVVERHRDEILALASALIERGRLDGAQIEEILKSARRPSHLAEQPSSPASTDNTYQPQEFEAVSGFVGDKS
ncbi:AAA family ATPase [Phyllobacterium myrsinacearum]|uniref:F0F1-type ATP synthase epsilon subunit n=1 Tax=Phyllobacterium myrsinacearum TaxID=28101 RepID=A0A839EIW7_9HYPH|nr:AAA family ATPase [Phyllobacterium myrsinacearum]MBA8878288.1 F0F1-type ATP synthase epsilon subunit [Phyllobacterium myrsinacearum]